MNVENPTPEELTAFICSNRLAFTVYLDGYERGYLEGHKAARLDQEQKADMLVRRQRALEYLDTEVRQVARSAADWVDVLKHRAAPDSAYVPMTGGAR